MSEPSTTDPEGSGHDLRDDLAALLADDHRATVARVAALQANVDDIIERSNEASRDDEHDPEGATIAFERAQALALLDSAQAHLRAIEFAQQRLADGLDIRCETCGEPIPIERLLARPTARTCVRCAS